MNRHDHGLERSWVIINHNKNETIKEKTVKGVASTLIAPLLAFLVAVPAMDASSASNAQEAEAKISSRHNRNSDLTTKTQGTVLAQVAGADEGYVEVNDARIFYKVQGEGEPMVLIHGYPLSGELFARNRDALAQRYKVITLDLRGYGMSVAPEVPASIEVYANDVLDVMSELDVPEAIIGGMSMGGPIVFEMYRQAPERFRGMILIDTIAASASIYEAGLWQGVAEQAAVQGVDSLVPVLMKDMLSGDTRVTQPRLVDFLADIIMQASVQSAVGGAYALANRPDSTPLLGEIDVPTLILVGLADTIYPVDVAQSMNSAIQNSTLVVIPGPAHAAIFEAPDLANAAILEWADKIN